MTDVATEELFETIILWQDHAYPYGYRPTLRLLKFRNGAATLELSVGGTVTRLPYTFPFLEGDRL